MRHSIFAFLILGCVINACGDRLPTGIEPGEIVEYDTARSDNSLVVTGAGYAGAVFDMSLEGSSALFVGTANTVNVIQSNIIRQPGFDPISTFVMLSVPKQRGGFVWDNLLAIPRDSSKVWGILHLGDHQYVSVEGSTTVIFAADVSNYITGTYSGTFATAFGDTIRVTEGKFNVPLELF